MHSDHILEDDDAEGMLEGSDVELEVEVFDDDHDYGSDSGYSDFFDFDHDADHLTTSPRNLGAQSEAEAEAARDAAMEVHGDDRDHDDDDDAHHLTTSPGNLKTQATARVKAGAIGHEDDDAASSAPPPPPSDMIMQTIAEALRTDEAFARKCHQLRARAKFKLAQYAKAKGLEYYVDDNGDVVILPNPNPQPMQPMPMQPVPQPMSSSESSSSVAAQGSGSLKPMPSISPHLFPRFQRR